MREREAQMADQLEQKEEQLAAARKELEALVAECNEARREAEGKRKEVVELAGKIEEGERRREEKRGGPVRTSGQSVPPKTSSGPASRGASARPLG